jgi:hypothetical protein
VERASPTALHANPSDKPFTEVIAVGTHPLLFIIVAVVTIGLNRRTTADDPHSHRQSD